MIHRRTFGALALSAVAVFAACDDDDPISSDDPGNIVEVAQADGRFETLITAASAAGLADDLSDANAELTVFAPTDDAFAALPAGTLDALLADTDALAEILLFHVVGGELDAAAVVAENFIPTLNGQAIEIDGDAVTASGAGNDAPAAIVITNIPASNGIIHVIDAVLLPETRNIVEIASDLPDFSTLVTAVGVAELAGTLSDAEAEFTVFAPTNEAFAALPAGTLDALIADPSSLGDILLYHTATGRIFSDEVLSSASIPTLQGSSAPISGATIDGATIVSTDIQATNGVIHVIDAVIIP